MVIASRATVTTAMLRFTIRDVLWLTALVGMGVGWWIHAGRNKAVIRNHYGLLEEINSSGIWMDSSNRVLMLSQDARGFIRIEPYVDDGKGNWGPEKISEP
jgi:hypothetical protein